ncbi:hypothetical protein [Vulcanisaeta distributa]|nr:hypothetical protein [Vulcanisaeta distributa]
MAVVGMSTTQWGFLVSDPGLYCIITITIQTAYALYKYGNDELRKYVPS